jgi:hypothetical protein
MRGRLYPQPRQRYERFRLNPYSPLYQGLAFFISAPPVAGTAVELHGPYALPGRVHNSIAITHQFFPEIGRVAINAAGRVDWVIALPPQKVITLTAMIIDYGEVGSRTFIRLEDTAGYTCALLGGYGAGFVPIYRWTNVDNTLGVGHSDLWPWPRNTWFTFSVTYRPGSDASIVRPYLSNFGIIGVVSISGELTTIKAPRYLAFTDFQSGVFVADSFVHLRELSLTELQAISDYSNVDLRVPGEAPLILPVRTYWPSVLPVAPSYLKRRSLGIRAGTREAAL